jgi:hypothetical protein
MSFSLIYASYVRHGRSKRDRLSKENTAKS